MPSGPTAPLACVHCCRACEKSLHAPHPRRGQAGPSPRLDKHGAGPPPPLRTRIPTLDAGTAECGSNGGQDAVRGFGPEHCETSSGFLHNDGCVTKRSMTPGVDSTACGRRPEIVSRGARLTRASGELTQAIRKSVSVNSSNSAAYPAIWRAPRRHWPPATVWRSLLFAQTRHTRPPVHQSTH